MSSGYFVLFHSEGMVKAITVPSAPRSFTFQGKTYQPSKQFLIDFNHLVKGNVLVGFQFLSPEDAGKEFLSSRFVRQSRNVHFPQGEAPILEIYLGSREDAETDQAAVFGGLVFATVEHDYILALPQVTWADLELGFELAPEDSPSPNY
jgi:hypothetical protein